MIIHYAAFEMGLCLGLHSLLGTEIKRVGQILKQIITCKMDQNVKSREKEPG